MMAKCLSLAPYFVAGIAYAALLALRAEDWGECCSHLRHGLSVSPGNLSLLYVSGLLEWRRGRTRRAIKRFSEVVRHRPTHFASSFHLAELLIRERRYRQAEELLLVMLKLQPTRGEVRLLLAEMAAREGNMGRVDSILAETLQYPPLIRQMQSLAVEVRR